MKRNIIRFAIIAILASLIFLAVKPSSKVESTRPPETHVEAVQEPIVEEPVPEPIKEPEMPQKSIVELNPNNCNTDIQWIWSDGTCHNKEVAPQPTPQPVATVAGDEYSAKMFIYNHESGNNPNAVNSIGCRGLGQACPGSKLPCGADYACQDAWFTGYMQSRYGSWANAQAFWLRNHWW